jgi:hypothetical protein
VSTGNSPPGGDFAFLPIVTSPLPDQWIKHYDTSGATSNAAYNEVAVALNDDLFFVGDFADSQAFDSIVTRTGSNGDPIWTRVFNAPSQNLFQTVAVANDGGLWVGGEFYSQSDDKDYPWLVRLDQNGTVLWQKTYMPPNTSFDGASFGDILATPDGGVLITINDQPNGGVWIVKLTSNGSVSWARSFGQFVDRHTLKYIQSTNDGAYILAGTFDFDGEKTTWLVKMNSNGSVVWQQAYRLSQERDFEINETFGLVVMNDGSYVVGVRTYRLSNTWAIWLFRINGNGSVIWQKSFDIDDSRVHGMTVTPDQGVVVVGGDSPISTTVRPWLFKIDGNGTLLWKYYYNSVQGIDWPGFAVNVQIMYSGDIVVAGAESFQNDTGFMVMRLTAEGIMPSCSLFIDAPITEFTTDYFEQSVNEPGSTASIIVTDVNIASSMPTLTSDNTCQ